MKKGQENRTGEKEHGKEALQEQAGSITENVGKEAEGNRKTATDSEKQTADHKQDETGSEKTGKENAGGKNRCRWRYLTQGVSTKSGIK